MKQITVTLPDGYECTTHLVLVVPDGPKGFAVNVIDATSEVIEEIGCANGLTGLMTDAARVVRNDSAVTR